MMKRQTSEYSPGVTRSPRRPVQQSSELAPAPNGRFAGIERLAPRQKDYYVSIYQISKHASNVILVSVLVILIV